jgi:hypothetical protein
MASFVHGRNAVFKTGIAGAGTTPTDISSWMNAASFPRTMDTAETTAFGSNARSYLAGFPNISFSIGGMWDGAASAVDFYLSGLIGLTNAVAMQYRPNGTASPSYDMVGNTAGTTSPGMFITSYSVSSPVNDVVSFTADFAGNLNVTRTP